MSENEKKIKYRILKAPKDWNWDDEDEFKLFEKMINTFLAIIFFGICLLVVLIA